MREILFEAGKFENPSEISHSGATVWMQVRGMLQGVQQQLRSGKALQDTL